MSPGNQGVFQLLKEVTFRRILEFYNSRKWAIQGASLRGSVRSDWLVGPVWGILQGKSLL